MNLFVVLPVLGLCYWLYKVFIVNRKYPSGPLPLPFIGNLLQIDRRAPHKSFLEWSKKYGPMFTFWLGNQPNIIINDYTLLKDYIVKKGELFVGRPFNYSFEVFNKGKAGLALSEGDIWKEQRRFALHTLRDFGFGKSIMEDKIQDIIVSMLQHIQDLFHEQGEDIEACIDPQAPLQLAIGNIILSIILGLKYKNEDKEFHDLVELFDSNLKLFQHPLTQLLAVYPFLENIPLFDHFHKDTLISQSEKFYNWTEQKIQEHKGKFNLEDEPTDFTHAYLQEMNKRELKGEVGSFTYWQLKVVIGDLYVAGMETTVTTLRWAILFLLHNPKVQTRVQQEIDTVVGRDSSVHMSHRVDMPFTNAVITEVQRLANIVPINAQHTTTQDVTINGYDIPKGTSVIPQMPSVHIDPDMFTDPLVFNPDRFINSKHPTKDKAETVMPFSMGKRQCLGESLAKMELFLIFSTLLQNYSFKGMPGMPLPSLQGIFQLTYVPQPYKCMFVKRLR